MTDIPLQKCPECGYEFDKATDAFGASLPHGGDVSICLRCAHISIYTNELTTREPTETEWATVYADERYQSVRRAIRHLKHMVG